MYWNYRVIENGNIRQISEVFYDDSDNTPLFYTTNPVGVIWDKEEDGLLTDILDRMKEAYSKPILQAKDFIDK